MSEQNPADTEVIARATVHPDFETGLSRIDIYNLDGEHLSSLEVPNSKYADFGYMANGGYPYGPASADSAYIAAAERRLANLGYRIRRETRTGWELVTFSGPTFADHALGLLEDIARQRDDFPQRVTDAVNDARMAGASVTRIAKALGVTRPTIYKMLRADTEAWATRTGLDAD